MSSNSGLQDPPKPLASQTYSNFNSWVENHKSSNLNTFKRPTRMQAKSTNLEQVESSKKASLNYNESMNLKFSFYPSSQESTFISNYNFKTSEQASKKTAFSDRNLIQISEKDDYIKEQHQQRTSFAQWQFNYRVKIFRQNIALYLSHLKIK